MKREIYCEKCATRVQKILEKESMPPNERVKYVWGTLKIEAAVCDFCNLQLFEGQRCCGFSNYIEDQDPYIPWEHEMMYLEGKPRLPAIAIKGIYGLLITGDEDQLMQFTISTSMVLNFIERRLNTVYAMCMAESLEFASKVAGANNLTLQYIDHDEDGNESYPVINKGSHALWQKGGYPENETQ